MGGTKPVRKIGLTSLKKNRTMKHNTSCQQFPSEDSPREELDKLLFRVEHRARDVMRKDGRLAKVLHPEPAEGRFANLLPQIPVTEEVRAFAAAMLKTKGIVRVKSLGEN